MSSEKKTVEQTYSVGNGVKRAVFAALSIILQVFVIWVLFSALREKYPVIQFLQSILAFVIVLLIYNQNRTAAMKMPWIVIIMAWPIFGTFMFLLLGLNGGTNEMKRRYREIDEKLLPKLGKGEEALADLQAEDEGLANEACYIRDFAGYPIYHNTDVVFYDDAAKGLEAQLLELQKAEKFIFMEYHAIEDTVSFGRILEVLKAKVKEGVEVRLFYDYVGSMGYIGNRFVDKMEAMGIRCRVFNPMNMALNFFVNNRDHRKITVIDGKVGFTGGYNLADEYFHVTEPFGHWLDTGLRLEGDAVKSITVTFLENWNAIRSGDVDDVNFDKYLPDYPYESKEKGYIQPFADSPLDNEQVGENVYMNVLRNAKRYAYFITPYLIITDEMRNAFAMAAKSGVDVRLITPGIPDKKLIYSVTRSYYAGLAENGVRIYEYTPGFCHAKQCVADDNAAVCGTINLDFRSLYHHFENGAFFTGYEAVADMKKQFDELFPVCREVTEEYRSGRSNALKIRQLILRFAAPLM